MSTASVTIDRTSLSLPDLVISDDGATYRLTEDGVGYVVQSVRVTTAPDSADVDGSEIIGFAREATSLSLEFHVIGASSAAVAASVAALEAAFYRLEYDVTRTVDGVSTTWSGGPCALRPKRGAVDSGVVAAHFDTFAVTIPFPNPNGA
jgi:hypothetical protein